MVNSLIGEQSCTNFAQLILDRPLTGDYTITFAASGVKNASASICIQLIFGNLISN